MYIFINIHNDSNDDNDNHDSNIITITVINIIIITIIFIIILILLIMFIIIIIIITMAYIGRPTLYTTATQRGWCIEAFVSILAQLQSQKSLPGGGGV